MEFITSFFEGLSVFTYLYLLMQVVIFVGLLMWYRSKKSIERETLDNIRKVIEQKKENGEVLTNYSLNELFKQQNQNSKYTKQWERYYKRILGKEADEKIKVDPYFGMDALRFAIGERGILEAGGGIHTSIGVLGTFIGLTYGLSSLDTLDPELLRGGIENLISGMTTAFLTSIIGVLLSLAWIFIDRSLTIRLEDKIDWHANELSLLLNADDEEIFLNRLEKISAQQAEQMTTLLTDALEKTFTPFMHTMQSNHESIATGFTKMESQLSTQNELTQQQIELSKTQNLDMKETLVHSLTSETKEIVAEFIQVLNHSKVMQEQMITSVGEITNSFEQAATQQEQLFKNTENMVESYTYLTAGMEKSQNSYEKVSEELSVLSVTLKEVQQYSNSQLPLQQEILQRSNQFVASSNELIKQFSEFGQNIQASQDNMLEQLMEKTELISMRFETLAGELTQSATAYLQANDTNLQLLTKTEETVEQLSPVVAYMEGTAESLDSAMKQLDRLQSHQEELINTIQLFSNAQLPVQENILASSAKFAESSTNLIEQFSQYGQKTQDAQDTMLEQLMEKTELISTRFETLAGELTQSATAYLQANDTNLQLLTKTEETVEQLSPVVAYMEGTAESLDSAMKQLDRLQSHQEELLNTIQAFSNAQLPVQQDILESSAKFAESSTDLIEQFSQYGQKMQDAQDIMLEQLMEKTELISTRFETLAGELTQSATAYLQANDTNLQLLSKTERTIEQLEPVVEYMEGTAESLNNTMGQLEILQERQAELIPHLQEWNEDVLTYLKDFVGLSEKQMAEVSSQIAYSKSQWESTATTFEETRRKLATSMDSFSLGIEKGLTTTFQEFEKELINAVKHFQSISGTYLQSQDNLVEAMNNTVDQLVLSRGRE